MRRPRIRLEPVAFGFGPVGKAVHIATALREEFGGEVDLELVAPGDFQQVATPRLFVQVGEAPSGTRADAVVTVMNSKRAIEIVECGERCYVVDSLAWLWDAPSPGGLVADAYLYQELPALPVPERNIQGIPRPIAIGAVGGPDPQRPVTDEAGPDIVVNLAGLRAPSPDNKEVVRAYLGVIAQNLLDPCRAEGRPLQIWGNATLLADMLPERFADLIEAGDQEQFSEACSKARVVITSPGLTTIVECLQRGNAIGLLPPQNLSQLRISERFLVAGIVGIRWNGDGLSWLARQDMPEPLGVEIINKYIMATRERPSVATPAAWRGLVDAQALSRHVAEKLIGPGGGERAVARLLHDDFTQSS